MINIGFNPSRIAHEYLQRCAQPIQIVEESESGRACLICIFEETDGILIESNLQERQKANLYILELKSSMGVDTWNHVKGQFRGATLKALSIANSMGINQIDNIVYFTAYVDSVEMDKTFREVEKQQSLKGIVARKAMVGVNRKVVEEWKHATIKPFQEQPLTFEHVHVCLRHENGVNVGTVNIISRPF